VLVSKIVPTGSWRAVPFANPTCTVWAPGVRGRHLDHVDRESMMHVAVGLPVGPRTTGDEDAN
jgi:hypothetical protein